MQKRSSIRGSRRSRRTVAGLALAGAGLALTVLSGCAAAIHAPRLGVERLAVDRFKVVGLSMDVDFRILNPNPAELMIESFEYDVVVNGVRLGRGYQREPLQLAPFGERPVRSRFTLNFLTLPIGVREVLAEERVHARVHTTFYVRDGGRLRHLSAHSDADVPLGH
jgi:LEA14-like dessication related protein